MIEKTALFGPQQNIVGILTLPTGIKTESNTGIIILNAGTIHRVGPYRMTVDIARSLAEIGFPVLRFDLSGIGDSSASSSELPENQRNIIECKYAMDVMTRHCGCGSFIFMGLCSGADQSHDMAACDPRVSGIVCIDGFAYPTVWFYLKDYGPALLNPIKWIRAGQRFFRTLARRGDRPSASRDTADPGDEIYKRDLPPIKKVVKEMQEFIDRGVRALFVFSGGIPAYYNYKRQFFHMYSSVHFRGRVVCRYFDRADHLFTDAGIRKELIAEIMQWVYDNFNNT